MVFSPTTLGSGLPGYEFLRRTQDQQEALLARSGLVGRETADFSDNIDAIQTIDDLMDNRPMLKVALGAFGLGDDLDNRAFIRQVLESDLTDGGSLANRLSDKRYQALAQTFNFMGDTGPRLPNAGAAVDLSDRLAALQSAEDLVGDRNLLKAALRRFGLEDQIDNRFMIQKALESDLSDPTSFIHQLGNPGLVAMAEAFDFGTPDVEQSTMRQTASVFTGQFDRARNADDLLAAPDLIEESLRMFGLEAYSLNTDLLRDVLNSDLNDADSVANTQGDPRFAALAGAFGFGNPPTDAEGNPVVDANGDLILDAEGNPPLNALGEPYDIRSKMERYVTAVNNRAEPLETPEQFLSDVSVYLATTNVFDIPLGSQTGSFLTRYLSSDAADPTALVNVFPDQRYRMMFDAFSFKAEDTGRTYPDGFVQEITANYVTQQFETAIGEADPAMRIALSLDREMQTVLSRASTNDGRWFSVMASGPLRATFESALSLPTSFGTLNIDRQLTEFKDRAERILGTNDLAELASADKLDDLRQRYLVSANAQAPGVGSTNGLGSAVAILSGFQG